MMQATQEQLANLLFPCLEPIGRLGTPVYLDAPPKGVAEVDAWDEGPAVIVHAEQEWGMWLVRSIATGHTATVPESYVSVMLEDATGRAHVEWALCGTLGLSGMHSPLEFTALDYDPDFPEARIWALSIGGYCDIAVSTTDWESLLEGLDPSDDTRLPDGSRLVDALALQAVALHVLGTREVPSGTGEVPAGPEKSLGGA